jgi:hypothetical protein
MLIDVQEIFNHHFDLTEPINSAKLTPAENLTTRKLLDFEVFS